MSKITRKKLTRGVALGTDHVHDPLDAIGVADADQVKVQWAPFRVTFNFPILNDANRPISIPFTLPPLQQFFDPVNKEAVKGTPAIILDEIAFSFDSRSERGAIKALDGSKDHATTKRCDVEIAIMEKSSDGLHFNKEVSSLRIPSVLLAGSKTERANPIAVDNINAAIDPYKSYLLKLLAPGLYDSATPTDKLVMPNATVSLRFRHPMVVGVTTAQNPPASLKGLPATITIDTPPGSTVIEASHLQVEMDKVDEVFLSKLRGGFPVDPDYHIDADSGYDVIAVPMFANPETIRATEADRLPYVTTAVQNNTFDRRIIPIVEPLLIHHIIVAANYVDTRDIAAIPPTTLTHHVGVGLGIGIRSESFTYTQIADRQWTPGTLLTVDTATTDNLATYQMEMVDIPITGTGGKGYGTQGNPFYVDSQFIEVRWVMNDGTGLIKAAPSDEVYVGTGGHWVYLICEKRLTGRRS